MITWKGIKFEQAFQDITAKAHKVDHSQFLQFGNYPIIDQGQNFIAGYINDNSLVWKGKLPVIIFGDHTRIVKFIDFPFVLGADGTKVLKPSSELFPLYAYYTLLSHEIPSAGYSRHFRFLKERTIRYPSLPEQQRIAAILQKADHLRRLRRYACRLSHTYLQSVFLEMFGDPFSNPKGWEIDSLDRILLETKNGFGQRFDYSPQGTIVLRIRDVSAGLIDYSDPRRMIINLANIKDYRLEDGDLLFVRVNGNPELVGRVAVFEEQGEEILFSDHLIRAKVDRKLVEPTYLSEVLNSSYGHRQTRNVVITTAGQFTINRTGLSTIKIPYPPIKLQQRFLSIYHNFVIMNLKQKESERQSEHLFQSLLHRAFQGEL
jgi:type I restriction enzyme S subunit